MYKKYGESRIDSCPFCGKISTTKNEQKIPVCINHKNEKLPEMKCICGEWLDIQESKFGSYFRCMRCGNISFKKAMEINQIKPRSTNTTHRHSRVQNTLPRMDQNHLQQTHRRNLNHVLSKMRIHTLTKKRR